MTTRITSRRTALLSLGGLGLSAFGPCTPSTDPGAGGGTGSTAFKPDFPITFEGNEGDPVGTIDYANGGRVYTTFQGGFGATFSAEQVRGGRTTSAALSIKAGSDGNPSSNKTGVGMGDFGIFVRVPPSLVAFDGDTLHVGVWLFLPSSFSFATNSGTLKFFRWTPHPNGDTNQNSPGRLDSWIMQGSDYYDADSKVTGPLGTQTGWAMGNELNHAGEPNAFPTKRVLPLSQWVYVEMMVKFTTDPTQQLRRIWVNDQFVAEVAGDTTRYYDPAGALVTREKVAVETLKPGHGCPSFQLFTYWNGNSPKDQTLWVDSMAFHKDLSTLPSSDELGNAMMGMANVGS